jgi:hypothetical protein
MLQFIFNERQRRDIHEREYWKYIANLRQQSSHSNMFYLSNQGSRIQTSRHRQNQYERIQRENDLLTKRLSQVRGQLMTKEQCEKDWLRHINIMKNICHYPENIDRFVSRISI